MSAQTPTIGKSSPATKVASQAHGCRSGSGSKAAECGREQHRHSAEVQPAVPFGALPQKDCCGCQAGKGHHRQWVENEELERAEEEGHVGAPHHLDGDEAAHDDHRYHPGGRDPAEAAVQVHAIGRDKDVLEQIDRDPPHEEEGVQVDAERRAEGRAPHAVLQRKTGDDRDRHHDCAAQEKSFVADACRNVRLLS